MNFADAIDALQFDPAFRLGLSEDLRASPHAAFRWETPPLTPSTVKRPWKYILVADPGLARPAEPQPFAAYFRPDAEVVAFESLGGDATLIVPCPRAPDAVYPHLAAFLRGAPASQIDSLWQRVGVELARRLARSPAPVWTSTAGGGVAWLHVRLDDRPKYYRHRPYTLFP